MNQTAKPAVHAGSATLESGRGQQKNARKNGGGHNMGKTMQQRLMLLTGAAGAALAVCSAQAQTPQVQAPQGQAPQAGGSAERTAALEERVRQLEEALRDVRQELNATRQQAARQQTRQPQQQGQQTAQGIVGVPPKPSETTAAENVAAPAIPAATAEAAAAQQVTAVEPAAGPREKSAASQSAQNQPPGAGFRIGNTTFRLSGFIKADAMVSDYSRGDTATSVLGRDFYLPQNIPVDQTPGVGEGVDFDAHAKQTRIVLNTDTPLDGKTVSAHIEADFQTSQGTQGSERTTNGYNFALRRAFITYEGWIFGQEWSNFQNPTVLPEAADFVGVTEGTVFARQMQARYTRQLSEEFTLSLALENPETSNITPTSAALQEPDDDHLPDATVKVVWSPRFGQFSLAGLTRQLSVNSPQDNARKFGWGLSAAGRIPFGKDGPYDVRFMLTYGQGASRYIGFNFAPDVIYVLDPVSGAGELHRVDVLAAFIAFRIGITEKLRSNIMASVQDVDYPSGVIAPPDANEMARSVAINLFYSPIVPLDLGIEYRYGQRKILNGDKGSLNRVQVVAKHAF